jgi:hypothetical protein
MGNPNETRQDLRKWAESVILNLFQDLYEGVGDPEIEDSRQ